MVRVRISTTVDADRWATARRLVNGPGSQVVDRALGALIDQLQSDYERAVLTAHPFESDEELGWQAPPGPDLPYRGAVPPEVAELAERRRADRTTT